MEHYSDTPYLKKPPRSDAKLSYASRKALDDWGHANALQTVQGTLDTTQGELDVAWASYSTVSFFFNFRLSCLGAARLNYRPSPLKPRGR